MPQTKRDEHMGILGRTGTGKSSLLRVMSTQDVRADRGLVHIDLHAETTAFMLAKPFSNSPPSILSMGKQRGRFYLALPKIRCVRCVLELLPNEKLSSGGRAESPEITRNQDRGRRLL